MKPIYTPSGKAKEYADLALNIYTGCPHRCFYCFAPGVLHRTREEFHSHVEPRKNIVEETRKQIEREGITGQTINLCFTCDPYPMGYDTSVTREIIKVLKESGNHVQILTKGDGSRDFDLLDGGDWYGVTVSCWDGMAAEEEPDAIRPSRRVEIAAAAKERGIKTWVSFEPVLDDGLILRTIFSTKFIFDRVKIGKLNYWPSDINWAEFGRQAEALCQELGLDYTIKQGLREEMEGKKK